MPIPSQRPSYNPIYTHCTHGNIILIWCLLKQWMAIEVFFNRGKGDAVLDGASVPGLTVDLNQSMLQVRICVYFKYVKI